MPEQRIDPLTGRRVFIAEDRAGRPTDYGRVIEAPRQAATEYSAGCPFCAGNEAITPHATATTLDAAGRWRVRVVPNKYPAVSRHAGPAPGSAASPPESSPPDGVPAGQPAWGVHEVVIESPRHATEMTDLDRDHLADVLQVFRARLEWCASLSGVRHATVFKNSGFAAGASLEHLHSQIVALPFVPPVVQAELDAAARAHAAAGACIYCAVLEEELGARQRLVLEQDGYAVVCAYAGRQPFETLILPMAHASRFDRATPAELHALAAVLQEVVRRLTRACVSRGYPLAYNLVLHTAPFDMADAQSYHWHWELIPRTTHLAGLEWGAGVYINPVSPERAARELQSEPS